MRWDPSPAGDREGLDFADCLSLAPAQMAVSSCSTQLLRSINHWLRHEIPDNSRVKRWQGGMMILRWTAAGVLEAERNFRKVAGYRALPKLVAALRAHDLAIEREPRVDNGMKAA